MKSNILFYIHVALLSTFGNVQSGNKTLIDHSIDVDMLVDEGKLINRIFKPSYGGYIGAGGFAFTFRGILLPINKEIVMKFTPLTSESGRIAAETEYKMYTYLWAINNTDIRRFGIPAVYYYGEWEGHDVIMLGLSLLEKGVRSKKLFESDVNVLIVLRDFILTSKYMHSCGIRNDDIKLSNMMTLKSRSFLIDFNVGHKLNVKSSAGTIKYKSRRAFKNGHRYPKDDWESFLYSMCSYLNVKFQWVGKSADEIPPLKEDTVQTIGKMEKIRSERLKNIFVSLAAHIFDDGGEFELDDEGYSGENSFYHSNANVKNRFPDYDFYYKLVNDEIKEFNLPEPVMFSWLTGRARDDAIDDLAKHPIPDITNIKNPTNDDYLSFEYPKVDKKYFTRTYKNWKPHVIKESSSKYAGSSSGKSY